MKKPMPMCLMVCSLVAGVGGFVLAAPGPRDCGTFTGEDWVENAQCPDGTCVPNPYFIVNESYKIADTRRYYVCEDGQNSCEETSNFNYSALKYVGSRDCTVTLTGITTVAYPNCTP